MEDCLICVLLLFVGMMLVNIVIYIYIYFMIAVPNKITKVDPGRVSAGYCLVNTTAPGMWTIKLPPDFCKAWVFLW